MKLLRPLAAAAAIALVPLVAGSGCTTRYSTPSRALGTPVSVIPDWDAADRVLGARVSAGGYAIQRVRLIDAEGRALAPDAAVREGPELVGGVRVGGGIGSGLGSGYASDGFGVRTGVGVGRTLGGRVVPGDFVARFLDPPLGRQPWTLRVTTAGDPAVTTDVLLAEPKNRDAAGGSDRSAPLELKLVTGETRFFTARAGAGGARTYEPAPEPADR
ncbi:hypothetical protein [Phycisphaera mikurensis]|uniref:Lipoprotein n=1 Tax=Phycisphaera mikurensis (strain NBRC 102666 / KCTC 22515 / FYK2301M01) TaxID=1142394 RepID=I0IIC8_PHYMF|nr:hypothetical protein [Phycisphaera mikurensis]MBB6442420.1 hypothetical protein [Phycisphaera mikurensis]BAM05016.1 hypothetical protein PSMK_28570 [Phycisphaera mikurensis NBRC 102666]